MLKQPCLDHGELLLASFYFRGLLGTALYSSTVAWRLVVFTFLWRLTRSSVIIDSRLFLQQRRAKVCDDV